MDFSGEKMSRREFLKSGFTAAAFLAELSLPKETRAQLEELIATQEFIPERFEETITRLKEMMWKNKNEAFWLHVKKGSTEGAMNIVESSTETRAQSVDLTALYKDKDVSSVSMVHTHPANAYFSDPRFTKSEAFHITRERKSKFPILPSAVDILGSAAGVMRLKEMGLKREAKYFVVEPSGVWSYSVDLDHPVILAAFKGMDSYAVTGDQLILDALGTDLHLQQQKIYREGGISEKNLEEFKSWAKDTWGIILSYQPFK